jgi:pimeloyl-ACP methyl ester carboxylesterase
MSQVKGYIDETNLQFKGMKFNSTEAYFKYMIAELGFPDIFHLFESKKIVTTGGLKINIDIHFYSKDVPTIVFVPGTSVYGLCFAGLLHLIGKEGYNIVALDPRGHGRSEGKRGDYTIEELMLDVRTAVDYAKKNFNEKVSIFGNSQGGIVSFYLAAEDIAVDSIICQNFADLAWEDTYKLARFPFLAKMSKPFICGIAKMIPNVTVSTLSYLDLKKIRIKYFGSLHNFIVEDPFTISRISMRAARSLIKAKMKKPVEEITIPIFVFQGDADRIFPVEYTKSLFNRIKSKKKIKIYEGCDHAIMVENEELVLPDILDWLKEIYPQ